MRVRIAVLVAALAVIGGSIAIAPPAAAAGPSCNANACSNYPPPTPGGCVYRNTIFGRVLICPR